MAYGFVPPDTITAKQLLKFGNYSFDLTELYNRKFRKEMFDKKGAFSNVNFFKPIYDNIITERNAEYTRVFKDTNFAKIRIY